MPGALPEAPGVPVAPPPVVPKVSVAPPPKRKLPVPDQAAVTARDKEAREVFASELVAARDPEAKKQLARELFETGVETEDPTERYVLWRLSLEKATEVGDPDAAYFIIDEIDKHYQIDALGMKSQALLAAWESNSSKPYKMVIFQAARQLIDTAMQAENYPAAEQAVRVAMFGARMTKDFRLQRELEERSKQIEAAQQTDG